MRSRRLLGEGGGAEDGERGVEDSLARRGGVEGEGVGGELRGWLSPLGAGVAVDDGVSVGGVACP